MIFKAVMKEDEYFDNKGYFCEVKVDDKDNRITKKFVQKTRGYVSFVRGKNPLTFPLAVYPEDKVTNQMIIQLMIKMELLMQVKMRELKI